MLQNQWDHTKVMNSNAAQRTSRCFGAIFMPYTLMQGQSSIYRANLLMNNASTLIPQRVYSFSSKQQGNTLHYMRWVLPYRSDNRPWPPHNGKMKHSPENSWLNYTETDQHMPETLWKQEKGSKKGELKHEGKKQIGPPKDQENKGPVWWL